MKFTSALRRFFPDLKETVIDGNSVQDVIRNLDSKYPGLSGYLLEEDGELRKHVNVFINNNLVTDRQLTTDEITNNHEIFIMQALSGG